MLGGPQVRFMAAPAPPPLVATHWFGFLCTFVPTTGTKYVRQTTAGKTRGSLAFTTAILGPVTGGTSLLIAAFDTYTVTGLTTHSPLTVSDSVNGTWTKVGEVKWPTATVWTSVWYKADAAASAAVTVTTTYHDSHYPGDFFLVECRGFGALDNYASATGYSTRLLVGPTPSLSSATELVFCKGACGSSSTVLAATTGLLRVNGLTATSILIAYKLATTTVGQTGAMNLG